MEKEGENIKNPLIENIHREDKETPNYIADWCWCNFDCCFWCFI
jgi:hypothetical protein